MSVLICISLGAIDPIYVTNHLLDTLLHAHSDVLVSPFLSLMLVSSSEEYLKYIPLLALLLLATLFGIKRKLISVNDTVD